MRKIIILFGFFIFGCQPENSESGKAPTLTNEPEKIATPEKEIQQGDLIFHTSMSNQSLAIQIASQSKYSHVGIIYQEGDDYYVYEAVQPVKLTPLKEFIARGKDKHYVVKRLKSSELILTPEGILKMKAIGKKYLNKNYDLRFEWSDDQIYCSELVWKMYKEAFDIEIGKLQQIKDFDLTDPVVKAKARERYGNDIPMEELIITPERMFQSEKLETIPEK